MARSTTTGKTLQEEMRGRVQTFSDELEARQKFGFESKEVMLRDYLNGRVLFDEARTREWIQNYRIHGNDGFGIDRVIETFRELDVAPSLTIAYTFMSTSLDHVFLFVVHKD